MQPVNRNPQTVEVRQDNGRETPFACSQEGELTFDQRHRNMGEFSVRISTQFKPKAPKATSALPPFDSFHLNISTRYGTNFSRFCNIIMGAKTKKHHINRNAVHLGLVRRVRQHKTGSLNDSQLFPSAFPAHSS